MWVLNIIAPQFGRVLKSTTYGNEFLKPPEKKKVMSLDQYIQDYMV